MGLYNEWKNLVVFYVKTKGENEFWKEYSSIQQKIYPKLLSNYKNITKGIFKELAKEFKVSQVSFMGFLDSINANLKTPINLDEVNEESKIQLDINFKKLYISMLEAEAESLYNLPQWNVVFSREEINELNLKYGNCKTIVAPKKVGRNDPCPCGSGKKYKNCCGKNK